MTYYIQNLKHATAYSKFRPSPPQGLVNKIVDFIKDGVTEPLTTAVDIGCGSGQSTKILSPYFKDIIGVDNNESQLKLAQEENTFQNICYRYGSAEEIDLSDNSVQLVTACQCAHWFNLDKFYKEVGRVLQPGGVLAIYGYNLPQLDNISSQVFEKIYILTLENYMAEESKLAYIKSYDIPQFSQFPFSSEATLRFRFHTEVTKLSVAALVGFVSTSSSFQNYQKDKGEESAAEILLQFQKLLMETVTANGKPEETYVDTFFPYFLLIGRKNM